MSPRPLREATRRLEIIAQEADRCRACDLRAQAPQTAFGEGPVRARIARGAPLDLDDRRIAATVHPSAVLRAADGPGREAACTGLVRDLQRARGLAA